MKKSQEIRLVDDSDILKLYWGGYTIDRLVRFVAGNERCTKGEAKQRVEMVVYQDALSKGETE